jgi:predicted ABC-type ATPase
VEGGRPDSTRPENTRPDSSRPDGARPSTPPAGSGTEHSAERQHRPADENPPATTADHHGTEPHFDTDTDLAARGEAPLTWSGEGRTLDPAQNAIADRFLAHAAESAGKITPEMDALAKSAGGHLEGVQDALKTPDSFKRKFADQLADDKNESRPVEASLSEMKDAVRYTVELPPEKYVSGAQQVVHHLAAARDEHGNPLYEQVNFKNFWGQEKGYVGINSFWLDRATGQTFEVQIHTPDSFVAKTVTHHDLEIERTTTDPIERKTVRDRADVTFAEVARPEGAAAIRLPEGTPKISEPVRADLVGPFLREGEQPTSGTPPGDAAEYQQSRADAPPATPADPSHEVSPETPGGAQAQAPELPERSRFVSDDEALQLVRDNARQTPSGYAFYPEGDPLLPYAEAVHRIEGVVNLDVHGSAAGFHIDGRILTGEQFARSVEALRADGRLVLGEHQPIRLSACDVARGHDSPAAHFARESGHPVTAPTERMWSDRQGNERLASAVLKDGRWVPKHPPDGEWRTFEATDTGRIADASAEPVGESRSPHIEQPASRNAEQPGRAHDRPTEREPEAGRETPAEETAPEPQAQETGEAEPVPEQAPLADVPSSWGIPEFPLRLPEGHPLLTPTDTINTPEREAFRRNLVDEVLGDAHAPESGRPVVYLMGGGGASGKGFVLDELQKAGTIPTENVVHLDPDGIKADKIPEYKRIVEAGDSRAAAVVHEESSTLAKRILAGAIDRRASIVYDVTLGDPRKAFDTLQRLRSEGYEIRLFGVSADADVAVLRNSSRAAESGRYVPIDMQLIAHRGFSRGFEAYAEMADSARLYDTNGREPVPVAIKVAGDELRVLDPERYGAFQHKGELDPHAADPASLFPGPREIVPSPTPHTGEQYVDQAMENLGRTSRTAAGTVDTSASVEKAGQLAANLSGDRAAAMALGNYRGVLTELYAERNIELSSPAALREMVEQKVREINSGILREGVLYREHDSARYPSYTAVADLPASTEQFFAEFHQRLSDPRADAVETAAWVEYRMDMTDHPWADGCGKSAKAIAAWVLMRHGYELPDYPQERSAQFAHAPKLPRSAGPGIDGMQYREWVDYYRGLFGGSDG